jgi:hypothetical protein
MIMKQANIERKGRRCPECGKHFKPMEERLWNAVLFMHRIASKRHGLMLPKDDPYIKRAVLEYQYARKQLGQTGT